jgi:osmotically-inducible protein OsmY
MHILVPIVLALLMAAPAPAQPRSDTLLRDEITAAIEEANLPIGIFEVEVRDGVAVLSGEVLNESTRTQVVELALFVDGVVAVETDIAVLQTQEQEEAEEEGTASEAPAAEAEEAAARAPAPPPPARTASRADETVQAEVAREIERADLEGGDPQVSVVDGVVRLTGQVASAWEWRDVVERAESVAGVLAVDPDLEVAEPESMDDLVEGVRRAVLRYSYYTVFDDINFGMEQPYEIVLLGAVTEPFKKTEIEKRVSRVFGVKSVDNRIEVLPLSPNDQDLRRALFYRIYRDPRFSDRANRVNPPIHIVVSRGVVALTGVVRSAIESRILESIARSTPGVFRVINRLEH